MSSLIITPPHVAIAEPQTGLITPSHYKFLLAVQNNIQAQLSTQQSTIDRIRRVLSHTSPTTIIHAADAGGDVTITIDAHTRVFGDATTLAVNGGTITGLTYSTTYALYYDDPTLADASPTFLATTTIASAQSVVADGRFFLGVITTPAALGATVDGGGVYPVGSSVGGEL